MMRTSIRITAAAFFILFGFLSLSGVRNEPESRKIDPLLVRPDVAAARFTRGRPFAAPLPATATVPVFIRMGADDPTLPGRIRNLAGTAKRISPRVYTARIPAGAVRYVSQWPSVAYIEAGRPVRPLLDLSRPAVSADRVQAGTGLPGGTGFTGRGVLVGIVDTGLDGTHPDFSAGDPAASRVNHTCSFSPGSPPLEDTYGHGTHVAGIAAGNGAASAGLYGGMAPQAGIMVGRAGIDGFYDTDVIDAVSDMFDYAERIAGEPAAINLSLGSASGPHDGTGSFESAIDELATGPAGSRRLVTVAAGNEQDLREHFGTVVPSFGAATAYLTVKQTAFSSLAVVEFWADGEDRYAVTATRGTESLAAADGDLVNTPSGNVVVANGIDAPANGAKHILVMFAPPAAPAGISAAVRLDRVRNGGSGKVDGYIDYFDGAFDPGSALPSGTITEPANADNVIAVGSCRTKTAAGSPGSLGISSFSSTGPTRDGRPKPDVAAPGEYVYSARSFQAAYVPSEIVPGNDSYAVMRGTSMAAPHATGIAALAWESNPGLTGSRMRERLKRTADAVAPQPNAAWGFGRANALRAVRESVAAIDAPRAGVPGVPVALSSGNSSAAFSGNALSFTWSLAGRPADSGASLSSNAPTAAFTPDVPGDYTVRLEVSQAFPAGTPQGAATSVIHVNRLPAADFAVPASQSAGRTVTFRGTASDADGQALSLRWRVVSRPAGSNASIAATGADTAALVTDVPGTYEIGLCAGDGLDNGALAVHPYTSLDVPPHSPAGGGGGGGGGCAVVRHGEDHSGGRALAAVVPWLVPGVWLGARRVFGRGGGRDGGAGASSG